MSSADQIPNEDATQEREPRDARRRRELINATIESISKHGLSQTTVAKVAEIAGLSAGIVSFYFRTKDALMLATLEHIDLEFERRQQEVLERAGDDPVRQLEAIIDVYFDPEVSDPGRVADPVVEDLAGRRRVCRDVNNSTCSLNTIASAVVDRQRVAAGIGGRDLGVG